LLDLVVGAVDCGWHIIDACNYLELPIRRFERWRHRALLGELQDKTPGGNPVHGLLPTEIEAILAVFEEFADIDRSHRKLAHRGSYENRFWASPTTVRKVLFLADKHFKVVPRPAASQKRGIPAWVDYRPNQVWIYDTTHFTRCEMAVLAIIDLVSRKWICEVVSSEETSTQVEIGFDRALELEGIYEALEERDKAHQEGWYGPDPPILLAMSDWGSRPLFAKRKGGGGPQMRSGDTAEFMALASIAQHFGRPGTPQDQAWVESFFGHVKAENPHLTKIRDPQTLRAELTRVREQYNSVRLHEGIGYVTPNDEHEGRGEAIRQARIDGMKTARELRIATHQQTRTT
jgi:putative transposase